MVELVLTLENFQTLVMVGVWLLVGHLAINLLVFRRPSGKPRVGTSVSVLIPARNEAGRIGPCLRSLIDQKIKPDEILVLDDRSTDGTRQEVESFIGQGVELRCLEGDELPEGWTGKAWACHQLAAAASGEVLVFTDADTRHRPDAIASAVGWMQARRADWISLWPRQTTVTWGEKLVVPFVHILLLCFLPHWMPGRWRSLGAANGQFIAVTREAYKKLGGHEAVRNHLVEDVALARRGRELGLKTLNADGSRHVECRMYENFPQVWEGFSKNLRAGCDGSIAAFLILQGIQLVCFLLPFFWMLAGLVAGAGWVSCVGAQILGIYTMRALLVWKVGHSLSGALLHPLGQVLELAIALNSWRNFARRRITWKGRTYSG
jgi:chlorobactene glucosyltransferase